MGKATFDYLLMFLMFIQYYYYIDTYKFFLFLAINFGFLTVVVYCLIYHAPFKGENDFHHSTISCMIRLGKYGGIS